MKVVLFLILGVILWAFVLYNTFLVSVHYSGQNFWQNYTWNPMHGICEKERTLEFIREPANAWSDFSYLAIGIYISLAGIYDLYFATVTQRSSLVIRYPSISIVFGIWNIIHACGTFWFHSCRCDEGGRWDQGPMHAIVSFPIFYTVYQYFTEFDDYSMRERSTHGIFLTIYSIAGACFVIFKPNIKNEYAMILIVTLIFVSFGFNYFMKRNDHIFHLEYFWATLILFGVGMGAWLLDSKPNWCWPESWFQFHAVWHVLTAIALLTLYLYLRTEEEKPLLE